MCDILLLIFYSIPFYHPSYCNILFNTLSRAMMFPKGILKFIEIELKEVG